VRRERLRLRLFDCIARPNGLYPISNAFGGFDALDFLMPSDVYATSIVFISSQHPTGMAERDACSGPNSSGVILKEFGALKAAP
jgi:hypothetical protein